MRAVADFLAGIGEAIIGVVDFIISFFSDIAYVVQMLGIIAAQIPSYFSWLPSTLLPSLVSIFALVILYKVIGREG